MEELEDQAEDGGVSALGDVGRHDDMVTLQPVKDGPAAGSIVREPHLSSVGEVGAQPPEVGRNNLFLDEPGLAVELQSHVAITVAHPRFPGPGQGPPWIVRARLKGHLGTREG